MQAYTKRDYEKRRPEILDKVKKGAVFIYPTDTIYGIGCDATNEKSVARIRQIKGNNTRPFSVMVPDADWISSNCDVAEKEEEWIAKLPGPYTLVLPLTNPKAVAQNVSKSDTLGIRIPAHWATELSKLTRLPIVSTSANLSGGMYMTSIEDLNDDVKKSVDFIIDVGEIGGRPSTLVNLTGEELKVLKR
jgi:L-threonylcarbamoyladenylate synthase